MRRILLLPLFALAACNASQAEGLPAPKPAADVQGAAVARIESIESPLKLEVQFNPAQIEIDKKVSWQKHKNSEDDAPTLEFTAAQPKTMDVELMFDMFEKGDVNKAYVNTLEQMALTDPGLKRPPMVTFTWGNTLPVFKGVIEDLNVKYTLFLPDGTPCRATVNLKMKQANKLLTKKSAAGECSTDRDCPRGEICSRGTCVAQ